MVTSTRQDEKELMASLRAEPDTIAGVIPIGGMSSSAGSDRVSASGS